MNMEEAANSIFLQCIENPKILSALKKKLSMSHSIEETDNDDNDSMLMSLPDNRYVFDDGQFGSIMEKLSLIIKKQDDIHQLIKTDDSKEQEHKADMESMKQECANQISTIQNAAKKEKEDLEQKLRDEQTKYAALDTQAGLLEAAKHKAEAEAAGWEQKYNAEKDKVLEEQEKYSEFAEALDVWQSINFLIGENKEYIENLCGGFNILSTLSAGRDEGKIDQLWAYIRDQAVKNTVVSSEFEILNKFFAFCVKVYNSTKKASEQMIFFDVEEGNDYEMDTSIRTSDSRQIGLVTKMIMRGVKVGKSIKYKAVVKVE